MTPRVSLVKQNNAKGEQMQGGMLISYCYRGIASQSSVSGASWACSKVARLVFSFTSGVRSVVENICFFRFRAELGQPGSVSDPQEIIWPQISADGAGDGPMCSPKQRIRKGFEGRVEGDQWPSGWNLTKCCMSAYLNGHALTASSASTFWRSDMSLRLH